MKKASKSKTGQKTFKAGKRERSPKERLEEYIQRASSPKDRDYFRAMFVDFIHNNTIPLDLLKEIPIPAHKANKTRFDQLYDAAMSLAFPGYRNETLEKLLGPGAEVSPEIKIWRAIFPPKFKLSHVLIRANSYQHAFALGCDYACRMSLRLYRKIPFDLTIRIQFVSEKAVRRMLDMRWANRVKRRKELQLEGRKYTPKELAGARLVALGQPDQPEYSIAKYAEARDLKNILRKQNRVRISSVETETFRPK
jgi:hypothetical protein